MRLRKRGRKKKNARTHLSRKVAGRKEGEREG